MFKRFAKKKQPPTPRQLARAKSLGISAPESMSSAELADAIADVEERKTYGDSVVEQRNQWQRISKEVGFVLATYKHKREVIVDVLSIHDVYINDSGKLRLDVCTPKYDRNDVYGSGLVWDQFLDIPIESVLNHEPLQHNFPRLGPRAYKKAVKRGLRAAKKLERKQF